MTPEDRELLQALRRQQADLQRSLARLDFQLEALEKRAQETSPEAPPLPVEPELPPLPPVEHAAPLPPLPPFHSHPLPVTPTSEPPPPPFLPPLPKEPKPSFEFQFGRWLTRIGAVLGIITLVLFFSLAHETIFRVLGPLGILGLSAALCIGIVAASQRLERRNPELRLYGRALMALGLAGLYVVFYAAHSFEAVRVIQSPLAAGFLLLAWSIYVLLLAARKESQALALFAIALAYFSTAINPIGRFTMAADLILAGTVVVFLLRNGWSTLSYLSLLATYFALLRRLVIDENGELVLDTSRTLPFEPYAVYLIGAWVIFTAGVLFSRTKSFRGGKRLAFLSLNNGALAGLLTLTTFIAGYGYKAMGSTLLWTGVGFLVTSVLAKAKWRESRTDAAEVANAYLSQGLASFTAGLMGVYTGVTRGVLLAMETFFLGMAAVSSRNPVLKIGAYVVALFATLFLIWEIAVNAHDPWRLGIGGAAIMFANAWWTRREYRRVPLTHQKIVLAASYYCALALGLIAVAMATELSDAALPPALAFVAVALTFSIYLLPLYELPPLAQTLLIAAQGLVLFPAETGEALPRSSTAWVAALTLLLLTWWSRQRITRYGTWIVTLNFIYALALVGLSYHAVRPYVNEQTWMMSAAFLSFIFLFFGALTRVWPLALMGQLFLVASLYHFFYPGGLWTAFPWTWSAALVPIGVVYATGRAGHAWLRAFPEMPRDSRVQLRVVAYAYQVLALIMVVRWISDVVPASGQIATFLLSGTWLLLWNIGKRNPVGVRCSFVLSALGMLLVAQGVLSDDHTVVTFLNGFALLALLCQPTFLRHGAREITAEAENWILILFSTATGWLFVGYWVTARLHSHDLTMGWALYALFLFFFGLLVWERRQRWCGLAILVAALARVLVYDLWGFSNGYRVLTFFVLTLILLGLGFIYARFGERLKTWL